MIQKLEARATRTPQKTTVQKNYRQPEKDLPRPFFRARMIESVGELESLIEPWNRLIQTTVRPNPFFDPDFLIPALEHLNDGSARVLVVDAPQRVWPEGPRVLCALLPLVKRRFYGLPLSCFELWKHKQCFDCTPLVRKDCGAEVLTFVLDHLASHEKTSLLSFDTISGDGDFGRLLTDVLYQNAKTVFYRDAFTRACFFPSSDAETYINAEVSKNTRKGTQRLQRKLDEMGRLEISASSGTDNPQSLINDFLTLESSGWKGNKQTSLASQEAERTFFSQMARRSLASGKMSMLNVRFNGTPIGMACDLHQGDYGIAFKIAFDESYAEFSPGLVVAINNIHRLHASNVRMMDSCADPNHSMINRVWSGRTRFQSLVVALRGNSSRMATALMPFLQLLSKLRKRQEKP